MADLPANGAARLERARADFVKGTVRPDAPGMVYYPSLKELAQTYELVEAVVARTAREDDWLDARKQSMNTSLVTPFSAAVDADPNVLKRSEIVAKEMEEFDDHIFRISKRANGIAEKVMGKIEEVVDDDPALAVRMMSTLAKTMESIGRTAKTAYDPAAVRPDNTFNILNVSQVQPSEDLVGKVAQILAEVKQNAITAGVPEEQIEEAELVEDE